MYAEYFKYDTCICRYISYQAIPVRFIGTHLRRVAEWLLFESKLQIFLVHVWFY